MSPIIEKKDTYRFSQDDKYRQPNLQCDTAEEFECALRSLKTAGSLPESADINNIMSLVKAQDVKHEKWDLKLDKHMQKVKSLSPPTMAAIIGAGATIVVALIVTFI